MANTTIVLKKSGVPGNVPSVLANGELSINYADGKLFYRAANGTITSISGSGGSANSFATINANSSLILATSNNDTLSIVPGNNISFTTNTTTKSITIHSNTSSGGGGTVALNGFSPNTVITANSTGYLSNTTNLNFFTSNNNLVITGNIIAGGVRSTSSGSTPPSSPTVGDIWYDTSTDIMYRYTYDGTNSNWLDVTSPTITSNASSSVSGVTIGKSIAMSIIFGG